MALYQKSNDNCPVRTEEQQMTHATSRTRYTALVLHTCREPYSRWAGEILLQGQKYWRGLPETALPARDSDRATRRQPFPENEKSDATHSNSHCINRIFEKELSKTVCQALLLMKHNETCRYSGNYGVQFHTSTVQIKRRDRLWEAKRAKIKKTLETKKEIKQKCFSKRSYHN